MEQKDNKYRYINVFELFHNSINNGTTMEHLEQFPNTI